MSWDELEMVTLRKTTDGGWSFTVYGPGFKMICSNRGLPDAFACIEQIQGWLVTEPVASGGMESEPAGKPAKKPVVVKLSGEAIAKVRNVRRRRPES